MVYVSTIREGGFLISKIKQVSGRIFDKKLRKYNITDLNSAQGRIIFSLWQKDNIPIKELATKTSLGKTTLTSMLDRLEQSDYITREPDKEDKRKVFICLTEKSKSLRQSYEDVSHEMLALFYDGLSEEQVDVFEETLNHILTNLNTYEEENK